MAKKRSAATNISDRPCLGLISDPQGSRSTCPIGFSAQEKAARKVEQRQRLSLIRSRAYPNHITGVATKVPGRNGQKGSKRVGDRTGLVSSSSSSVSCRPAKSPKLARTLKPTKEHPASALLYFSPLGSLSEMPWRRCKLRYLVQFG